MSIEGVTNLSYAAIHMTPRYVDGSDIILSLHDL